MNTRPFLKYDCRMTMTIFVSIFLLTVLKCYGGMDEREDLADRHDIEKPPQNLAKKRNRRKKNRDCLLVLNTYVIF